jgi:Spy/CpxP family protein refolding chaperone
MKRITVLAIALMTIGLIAFVGCNKLNDPVSPNTQELILSANIPAETEMCIPSQLNEATLDKPAMLLTPNDDPFYPMRPIKFMTPLGRILKELNLTDEQKAQIREFFNAYHDCVKSAMTALRESEKQILDQANQARRQVMEQLKSGAIDRQTAMEQLRQINQRTREALINNPVRQQTLEQLKNCWDTLISNIKSVLTDEQNALFDQLLAKYRDNRGGGKGNGGGTRP